MKLGQTLISWALLGASATLGCASNEPVFSTSSPMDAGARDGFGAPISETGALRDAIPLRDTGNVTLTPDSACATTTADAQRRPANILIVLDRSGSMSESAGNGMSKWAAATGGLRTLLGRLDNFTRVGLTFFPPTRGASDMASGYTTPAVPIAALSTNRTALLSALGASPSGNTPMACAIDGSKQYFQSFTQDGSRNIILITDGQPTNECTGQPLLPPCNLLPPDLACLQRHDQAMQAAVSVQVALARMLTPSVRTFVAGTPEATDVFLSDLAFQGGSSRTPDCRNTRSCHYSLGAGTFEQDLARALDDIRGRAITCEFEVNADPSRVDPTRVNVSVETTGMAARTVPRDVNHQNGWDYSEGMRNIILHGPICDAVRTDPQVRVQILFGCPTLTPG
ncbi:MAG: VWA domain-containing protein [Myxococcales bacterium]|nr:VWA domain-containing protein [Myxococcales bacterium]